MSYGQMDVFIQNLQENSASTLSKMSKTLNARNFLNIYLILDFQNCFDSRNPTDLPLNQFSQLLKMIKIYIFLTLIVYITFKNENIIPTNMCYNQMDVFIQNLQENSASTLSKMSKNFECS